tara:strand:- start:282 stop:443 length:162 start_codon:yes stop_codon:yes gene_type:complete
MKVKNRISKIVIEVTQEHYDQVLARQGWLEEVSLITELKKEVEAVKLTKGTTK